MSSLTNLLMKVHPFMIAASYVGYMAYEVYSFKNSPDSELVMKQQQLAKTESDLQAGRAKLETLKAFYQVIESKREEVRRLAIQLNELKLLVQDKIDVPETQKAILTEAKRAGLNVQSWSVGDAFTNPDYGGRTFAMEAKGLFFRYMIFLDRITSAARILRVKDIDFTPSTTVAPATKFVELNAKIEIIAYNYNQSKADAVAQQQSNSPQGSAPKPAVGGKP